jgi:regulator of RNase E activity RraB
MESKDIVVLELLDDESTPQTIQNTVHRITMKAFQDLGKPAIGAKAKLTLEFVQELAPATP